MKKVILGSLNVDNVYSVHELVKPKETIRAVNQKTYPGGKGFNQAIALQRSGSEMYFAGVVGRDGSMFLEEMKYEKINYDYLKYSSKLSGSAVIQVSEAGENCIIVSEGANGDVNEKYIDELLSYFAKGDVIILQNEVPCTAYAAREASKKGMRIMFNPSPFDERAKDVDINDVDYLFINEVEGEGITGCLEPKEMLKKLHAKYPGLNVVLTVGSKGAYYLKDDGEILFQEAYPCEAVDTTAAGDTFTGYFITEMLKTEDPVHSLKIAAKAAAIAVTRVGASPSIPYRTEVECDD